MEIKKKFILAFIGAIMIISVIYAVGLMYESVRPVAIAFENATDTAESITGDVLPNKSHIPLSWILAVIAVSIILWIGWYYL